VSIQHAVASADWTGSAPIVAVLLHGFGSNENDLTSIGRALLNEVPWVSPRGPLELAHGGAAWFPITTPGNPDALSVAEATGALWAWIDDTLGPTARLLPIGFSQGGLMATQLLRTQPHRVAATVILGGFVQAAAQPADELLSAQRPSVFWGRGENDRVITAAAVQRTGDWLPGHSTLTARTYPRLAHSISPAELADVRTFLDQQLGRTPLSRRQASPRAPSRSVTAP